MLAEIRVPPAYRAACLEDLHTRRGRVRRVDDSDGVLAIEALVPLANMFGYTQTLRMRAEKKGTFSLVFDHYAPVMPPDDDDPSSPAVALRA